MISFAYITYRDDPCWQWYIDSLVKQCWMENLKDYEVICVDGKKNEEREQDLLGKVGNRFSFKHVLPKPSVWNGKYRLTKRDFFALSNARNTALCYASGDRVIFSDDVSVLNKDYVKYHLEAHNLNIAMAGIQRKVTRMIVSSGELESFEYSNRDSREEVLSDPEKFNAHQVQSLNENIFECPDSAWLYGNNFSIPLEMALSINGFDEIYDGQYGVEDCDFSIRLVNAGNKIYINPKCILVESIEAHEGTVKYPKGSKDINGRHANESKCFYARDNKIVWTTGNSFNLRELRESILNGGKFPIPTQPDRDWRDEQKLCEMT